LDGFGIIAVRGYDWNPIMHFTARIVCCLALAITLSGCSKLSMPEIPSFDELKSKIPKIYKFDIQQGNVITQDMIDKLKPGMTKSQVRFIMGTPLIADTFSQNRWDYFYSLDPADRSGEVRERVAIFFQDDLLVGLRGDFIPGGTPEENASDGSENDELENNDSEDNSDSDTSDLDTAADNTSADAV